MSGRRHDDDRSDDAAASRGRASLRPFTDAARSPEGFTDELGVATDPVQELRAPLTVLVVLAPLALLGELYRFVGRPAGDDGSQLLADPVLEEAGAFIGMMPPLMPLVLLTVGCVVAHLCLRRQWRFPGGRLLLLALGWAGIWGAARVALGLAAQGVNLRMHADAIVEQVGLGLSGALHEELLFRGVILGGMLLIGRLYGASWTVAGIFAVPLSAAFFSLAHSDIVNHFPGAEPFAWSPFIERGLAGCLYGFVFMRHGLAVCTLAHAAYNIAWVWLA
ncbi:MAG TPA: CPBP family intramembrane glutamic endopeptidase [Planctomycetota bacterium]|nr:CPBP family intramembrane glutamic endopeptidase [Planctomycetota bacterium]